MRGAEPCGCLETPEPAHRVVALLDAPVILLKSIIEIATAAMDDLPAERPADGTRVGVVPVRRHPVRDVADHRPGPAEEASDCLQIARATQ